MVDLKFLGKTESPPRRGQDPIILVHRIDATDPNWQPAPSGRNIFHHSDGVTFLAPSIVDSDLKSVIEQARAYAERHGISVVFVKDELNVR